jgi:phospholipase/lecithinase/hemolysin
MHCMDTVVVFGDSLSDIGTKWKQVAGSFAYHTGQLTCSPTGRFSDCRNWTDYMFEAAGGSTLIQENATASIEASSKYHRFTSAPSVLASGKRFTYVNYAVGGACGIHHSPMHWSGAEAMGGMIAALALSTFANQVKQFEDDLKEKRSTIGNTLFLIWFGANDLYTASCNPNLMNSVAKEVAGKQRLILHSLVQKYGGSAWFIFMDIAYPLSSVRYSEKLKSAKDALKQAILQNPAAAYEKAQYQLLGRKTFGTWSDVARKYDIEKGMLKAYEKQVKEIKDLENGVWAFNSSLVKEAESHGDRVVNLATVLDPETLKRLVRTSERLKRGAMTTAAEFNLLADSEFLTTNDKAHPTDPLYRLIWQEIHREIFAAGITFGSLPGFEGTTTLRGLNRATLFEAEQRDLDETMPLLG